MSRDLDIRCAQALGYTDIQYPGEPAQWAVLVGRKDGKLYLIPFYSRSIEDAADLEADIARRGLQEKYADCLMQILDLENAHLGSGLDSFEVWQVMTATAEQRAAAFLAAME